MSGLRFVAFDLGGVLVDVDRPKLARTLGRPTADVDAAFFGDALHDDVTIGAVDGDAFVAEAARRLQCDVVTARAAWAGFVAVLPGADALVRALRVPCLAWSNTDPVHWERIASQLPSLCRDASACTSFALRAAKPDPEFYARAVRRAGVAAHEILFLDDREENVAAAARLGIDARRVLGVDGAARAIASAFP